MSSNDHHAIRSVTVRIPADIDDWLREEADRRLVGKAFLVRAALERLRDAETEAA